MSNNDDSLTHLLIQTLKKIKDIKLRIEEEIKKINNSYKKIEDEITSAFKKKHEELNEKEKKLKLNLESKVKEIKDQLNQNLFSSNLISCSYETNQEKLENYENNNIIKTLYYISEIDKINEKVKYFCQTKIRNINTSYNSNLDTLDHKDYYFNGIPIPKNIKFKPIG